ncbi:uncharacterized protein ccdc142 isoform X3 [Ictalurus punctatus]|uniref:Uncharacterized protein ccdc142 isoform X3 n=1 Tax=Ictalurus punctatus TaxID=7998 RepID=A0A2D0RGI4_ICTPU|nr:uncharacterized protein ccdc142 isoform X3 [Ictalurus punctatus]
MAQTSSIPQEGHSEAEPNQTQTHTPTHPHAADRALPSAVTDSSELQASDTDQKKTNSYPEILPDTYLSKDKRDGRLCSPYQGPVTKSRRKTDPLFQTRSGSNLKHLLRQKSDSSTRNYENGDHFVARQDLTSRSSQRLQQLERTLVSLRSQCRVLRGSGGCLRGCVTGLTTSGEAEFYHHPQAPAFSQHYAQLQNLLEQRAQLLFLHEYGRRCRAAKCFISRLGDVLGKAHLLASRGQNSNEQANSQWNLDLRAMCEELQVHVRHWDMLYARVRSDPFLRAVVFSRTEMLGSMQKGLWLLGQQALLLMENCMHTVLKALAAAQLVRVPRDALEDLLSALELYNQVIANPRSQKRAAAWSFFTSDYSPIGSGLPRKHLRPGASLVVEIMEIVARHRAQIAARQLYSWTCQQTDLLSLAGQTSTKRADSDCPDLFVPSTSDRSTSILDKSSKQPRHSFWSSSHLPLFMFAHEDREDILETFFQVLVSSTDLLVPRISRRPWSASAERRCRASGREENPKMYLSGVQNVVQQMDLSSMDARGALFSQYTDTLWREFGKAVIERFYYPSYIGVLGGMNQWNDQMVFLLVRWLKQACKEELVPAECKDVLNRFCAHVLSTAAFMHWDAIMCESLGLGTKDKCSPRATTEPSSVRTATMEVVLQLFPPLLSVLQLLQTPQTNFGEEETRSIGSYHLGLLRRAQATVQSATFWVMSKTYQFLASWSLAKFVLVTQGDLKALKEMVESLVQQLNTVGGSTDHHRHLIVEHGLQLSHAVSQLQAFSELVLRIFSMDCKKMSMEIFEQTMPSAKHWRVNYKTELPSTPSDYAAFAAQSVLGQVFEGVQPLPDETRIPALEEAMTAFMEAWMEHILKQKIKFSVRGALQLKQDFDLIRELIRSEKYSLSEELHQRLLSLHVFHQADSAIVCLLQQPVTKSYMPSQRWEPFRHCCPNRAQVVDQAVGSLNNLETLDIQAACHQALTRAEGSVSPELLSTAPPESYLAVAQQEWLDLRIHTSSRWRIPGLRCFTKSEP